MRLFSASEYEFGLIAVGPAPIGVVALGVAPVGLLAIGIMPMGLLTLASGGSVGVVSFVCGAGLGGFVRGVGVAVGGDAEATEVQLSLTGDESDSDRSSLSYWSVWGSSRSW